MGGAGELVQATGVKLINPDRLAILPPEGHDRTI